MTRQRVLAIPKPERKHMTAAATKEKAEPKVHREIEEFKKKYAEALEAAKISAEHTQTEGWKALYHLHRTTVDDRRKDLAEQLEELGKVMKRGGMSEGYEKQLSEIKKESTDLRADISAFQRKVITPVQSAVMECHAVIDSARRAAREGEERSPLTHRGLIAEMDDAIKAVAKVAFDSDEGTVEIE
jgi:hypothetical protein